MGKSKKQNINRLCPLPPSSPMTPICLNHAAPTGIARQCFTRNNKLSSGICAKKRDILLQRLLQKTMSRCIGAEKRDILLRRLLQKTNRLLCHPMNLWHLKLPLRLQPSCRRQKPKLPSRRRCHRSRKELCCRLEPSAKLPPAKLRLRLAELRLRVAQPDCQMSRPVALCQVSKTVQCASRF